MKKTQIILVVCTLFLTTLFMASCGGANSENAEQETAEQIEVDKDAYETEYSTLKYSTTEDKYYTDKDKTKLFSGTAGEKNSSDQLIKIATFKNGFLVTEKSWTDFGGELVLTKDMEYKDGKAFNGWWTGVFELEDDNFNLYGFYTGFHYVYKNGKENEEWRLSYSSYDSASSLLIGDTESCTEKGNFEYFEEEKRSQFFDCVKSKNLKNFRMYIIE